MADPLAAVAERSLAVALATEQLTHADPYCVAESHLFGNRFEALRRSRRVGLVRSPVSMAVK